MHLPLLTLSTTLLFTCFASAQNFTNPPLWQDHPDLDIFRLGSVFYYSSSTFAYSPGAPVLKSYDLVTWSPVSHSVPTLDFAPKYSLNGSGSAYVKGIWASTLRYHKLTDEFIWLGCVESSRTHVFVSSGTKAGQNNGEVLGEWNWQKRGVLPKCYYDAGMLIDDAKMYVVYGNPRIRVAEIDWAGFKEIKNEEVWGQQGTTVEGARMYRRGEWWYILVTRPADAEFVLRAKNVWGPYEVRVLVDRIKGPLTNAGYAHQGGLVESGDKWWYVGFLDAYPGGRIPVVAPVQWEGDWPRVVTDGKGEWGASYEVPVKGVQRLEMPVGRDGFGGRKLGEQWEWNHNPENSKWRLDGDGLVLQTVDVTTDLFAARNTLTQRIIGPKSRGTFRLDVKGMKDGDRTGAVLFRDRAAYVGVWKEGAAARVVVVTGLTMAEGTWTTTGRGTVVATGPTLTGDEVWLRIEADITPAFGTNTERTATFAYSVDGGKTFVKIGPAFGMSNSWRYFTGYRFGVFNHATKALGGEVKVRSFDMEVI
ncbi:hypothetical protein OQA88_1167 [Cercophora sp. LCS_1]